MEIFISYRRADSAKFTERLSLKLVEAFGEKSVFLDVNDILAGRDFQAALKSVTKNCNVMLVMIGNDWTRIIKERSSSLNDWVRFEVETGLNRKDILVIPVLINGAQFPKSEDLPVTIQELTRRNGLGVNEGETYERDVQNLIKTINEVGYKRIPGTVSASVSLHEDTDRDSNIVSRVSKGTEVILLEYNRDGTWAHLLTSDNVDGWAVTADFTLATEQPTQSVKEISVNKGFGARGSTWQIYFTAPGGERTQEAGLGIDARLADAITRSQSSIDIAAFEFNNKVLTEAILEAKERGLQVRVVTDHEYGLEDENTTLNQLTDADISIVSNESAALMHNKFMVLDGKTVWTGSWNYTENSTYRNNENSIVFNTPEIARLYTNKFEEMFVEKKFGSNASKDNFHKVNEAGITIEICFTPSETIEKHISDLILSANKSIHFMMFSFTNDLLGDAIVKRHKKGVQVFGIQEKIGALVKQGELTKFIRAGIQTRIDNNRFLLHHKVVVIDEYISITGSLNFSNIAFRINDENVIIIHDPALAQVYLDEFNRQWESAKPPDQQDESPEE